MGPPLFTLNGNIAGSSLSQTHPPQAAARGGGGADIRIVVQFIVGMTNSAPSLTPDGQREVTVLVLV